MARPNLQPSPQSIGQSFPPLQLARRTHSWLAAPVRFRPARAAPNQSSGALRTPIERLRERPGRPAAWVVVCRMGSARAPNFDHFDHPERIPSAQRWPPIVLLSRIRRRQALARERQTQKRTNTSLRVSVGNNFPAPQLGGLSAAFLPVSPPRAICTRDCLYHIWAIICGRQVALCVDVWARTGAQLELKRIQTQTQTRPAKCAFTPRPPVHACRWAGC